MSRGLLIAFEGIDKSGKGTQSKILATRASGVRLAFPDYTTRTGKMIEDHLHRRAAWAENHLVDSSFPERDGFEVYRVHEDDPVAFQCVHLANKTEAQPKIVRLLDHGETVVLDRWKLSSRAYGGADELDPHGLDDIHSHLIEPDLTIFLDVRPEVAAARSRADGDKRKTPDRIEKDLAFMNKVYANYRQIFSTDPRVVLKAPGTWWAINGELPEEAVARQVWDVYENLVKK